MGETGAPTSTVKPASAWWGWLRRTPGGDLIYRHTHKHAWRPHGIRTWPSGRTCPAYRCATCGATASDVSQGYGDPDPDVSQGYGDPDPDPDTGRLHTEGERPMSTYLYLRCEDHNPPLVAYEASGRHLRDLPAIRADIADREALVRITRTPAYIDLGSSRNITVDFLAEHPACRIGIIDEYGTEHPIDPEKGQAP